MSNTLFFIQQNSKGLIIYQFVTNADEILQHRFKIEREPVQRYFSTVSFSR